MKSKARLNSEERNFFVLITKAILSNPFLDERNEILIKIIPGFTKEIKSRMIELELIATALNNRIDRLEQKGRAGNGLCENRGQTYRWM